MDGQGAAGGKGKPKEHHAGKSSKAAASTLTLHVAARKGNLPAGMSSLWFCFHASLVAIFTHLITREEEGVEYARAILERR